MCMINIKKSLQAFVLVLSLMLFNVPGCFSSEVKMSAPIFIAHAGGAINNQTYTNSLDALNLNYLKGFRFFEIDFSWTSDGELVAIHDWNESFKQIFNATGDNDIPTKAAFLQLETKTGLVQLSLEAVLKWADTKEDAFIVTDVKDDNIKALRKMSHDFKFFKHHIIPQVYSYQEYNEIAALGYRNIILTLYKMKIDPAEVLMFSKNKSPFAITMHWKVAQSGIASSLHENNVKVYAHTINDINLFASLRKLGVYGIYTDNISPP
jgi:glycerophosphoryl diester phosphodiesterase